MAAPNPPASKHNILTFQLCYLKGLPATSEEKVAREEGKYHFGGQSAPVQTVFQTHSSLRFSCNGGIPAEAFCLVKDEYK